MAKNSEFEISHGVLQKYNGAGGVVVIPDSVQIIGGYAFAKCQRVTEVVIPRSVVKILGGAFSHCKGLVKVTIPDSVYSVGESAFEECVALTEIVIPDSVTEIGKSAFLGCRQLMRAVLSNSLKSIECNLFTACTGITEIVIPDSVKTVESSAFVLCQSLCRVVIGNSVRKVADDAFLGCKVLSHVVIGDSFTLKACESLRSGNSLDQVQVSEGNPHIKSVDGVIYSADMTKLIIYPKGRRAECFTVPDTVTCISDRAFRDCVNLHRVVIPKTVKKIGDYAFSGCVNLCIDWVSTSPQNIGCCAFSGIKELPLPGKIESEWLGVLMGCTPPEKLLVSIESAGILFSEFKYPIIRGFLKKWKDGELTEAETEQVAGIIKGNLLRTFDKLGDDMLLYEFATETRIITKQNVKKLLDKIRSAECRAILHSYLWELGNRTK